MNSSENRSEIPIKNQQSRELPRRIVLQMLGALAAVVPVSPDLVRRLLLPSIEAAEPEIEQLKRKLLESLKQFFPQLESVEIETDNTKIDGYINSLIYLHNILSPMIADAKKIREISAIPHSMYQDTVSQFLLNFGTSRGKTILHSRQSVVTKVEVYGLSNDPGSLTAEILHPLQAVTSIEGGVSAIILEAASTAIDLLVLQEWRSQNKQLIEQGLENQAVVMPMYNVVSGEQIDDPTVDQFNDALQNAIDYLKIVMGRSLRTTYKPQYLGEELLGQSKRYHRSTTFLQDHLRPEEFPSVEYQKGIEQQAVVLVEVMLRHNLSLRDAVILCGFINHGQDVTTVYGASQAVIDAYTEMKDRNLIVSAAAWQENKDQFSQITVENLRLNVAFALRNAEFGSNETLTLEAYMLLTDLTADSVFFDQLYKEDVPTATVYFYFEENGERIWYQKDLPVTPNSDGRTILYNIELPRSALIRKGIAIWFEPLKDKNMVVRVTQPKILGVDLGTYQDFEVKGEFPDEGVVSVSAAEGVELSEAEALSPTAAPLKEVTIVAKNTAAAELSLENQAKFNELREQMNKRTADSTGIKETSYTSAQEDLGILE